jgi:two-component system cell cycle sensor histidine kinase/response regulator CckA
MEDQHKTKTQLIAELEALRQEVAARKNGELASKSTEKPPQQSEERYRTVFHHSNDAIFIVDPACDTILDVNPQACRMLGFSRVELLSTPMSAIHPHEMPQLQAFALSVFAQGKGWTNELTCRTKTGEFLPAEISASTIQLEGKLCLLALVRDMSEREKIKETLQKERDFIAAVLDTASALVVVADLQGHIVRFNRACEQLTGYTFEEVQGKDLRKLFLLPEEGAAVAEAVFNKRQKSDFPNSHINHWVTKTGDCRLLSWSNTVLCDDSGRLEYIIGTGIDITERQQVEAEKQQLQQQLFQAQKLEALGTLAGGVAHDFNNLLSVMLGFTELACDEVPEESMAYQNLREVVKASRRARALVRQLLTFSRSTTAERRAVYLKPVVEETLAFLRASLPPNVEIQSQIAEGGWEVWADPTQVQQIVLNLCINGAQAMAQRGGRLAVSVQQVDLEAPLGTATQTLRSGAYMRITVSDSGCGMTPEVQQRIFEPFFTTKNVGEGSGLGLAVVHGIVSSYGGAIAVDSQPGVGTSFQVYLPLAESTINAENSFAGLLF